MNTRVKMCGITRLEDAIEAIEHGVNALGFVFYPPSPRYITPEDAAMIIKKLPPFVTSVGLFVNAERAIVNDVIQTTSIDLLQFHGDEAEIYCQQFSRPYIKAIRMKAEICLSKIVKEFSSASGLLLDTYVKGIPGGTGESFNWDLIPNDLQFPIILAGGLSPENIVQAIHSAKPYAVDVSGGIESQAGVKSSKKIEAFMSQVNNLK